MNCKFYCYAVLCITPFINSPLKAEAIERDSLLTVIQSSKNDTSKVNTLNLLVKELIDEANFEKGFNYANDAKALAEKLNYKKGIADALTNEGLILNKKKQYKQALTLHKEALKIFIDLKDDIGIRNSYCHIGRCYQWLNLYIEATSCFFKSSKMAEAAGDSLLLYKTLSGTAYSLQFMGNLIESITYQKKAIAYVNTATNMESYCMGLIFLADYYALNGDHTVADSILKVAYQKSVALKSPRLLSYYYNINSQVEEQRSNYGKAILSLLHSNEIEITLPVTENLPYNYANIANYILQADKTQLAIAGIPFYKKYDEVIRYGQLSLDITLPAGIAYMTSANYYHMGIAYQNKGNFEQALRYFNMHRDIKDSLFNAKNMETLQELKLKYETEKKEQQIKLLSKENQTKSLATEKEKQKKNFAFFGIAALIIMGGYIFFLYAKRKKISNRLSQSIADLKNTQEQLMKIERENEAEKTRLTISRDLHDDLGATLSSISVFSAAARQRLNDNNIYEAGNMLERISTDAQEMAASVSERVWMMKSENSTIEKLIEHLQFFASSVLTAKSISFRFNCDEKIKDLILCSVERKNIYLIFKEAINNAAKYSECSEVKLNAVTNGNELSIVLSDDGKGFDDVSKSNYNSAGGGNGLKNMNVRAFEINAQLQIISSSGNGTSVNFSCLLPIIGDRLV